MRDRFSPTSHVIGTVDVLPRESELDGETMLYQASLPFALMNSGPVTSEFLRQLPADMKTDNLIIDVRIHHLEKGYYPAIPGWHLDWMPRKNKGQDIDLSEIPERDNVVLIIGETSLTEFVTSEVGYLGPLADNGDYHKMIERYASTKHVESGQMVRFNSEDWHRPVAAEKREWRYLARASVVPGHKPANVIRKQSQVYIPIAEANW